MGSYGRRDVDVEDVRANQRVVRRLPHQFQVPVVGVSKRAGYPDNLLYVAELTHDAEMTRALGDPGRYFVAEHARVLRRVVADGVVRVDVRAEPNNPIDPDAVAVDLVVAGEPGVFLGYVPATTHGCPASRLASELRVGARWSGWVAGVRISAEHPGQPGVDVVLRREAEL